MGRKAVLEMLLFDNLLNSFNFTSTVVFVRILYFSTKAVLIE